MIRRTEADIAVLWHASLNGEWCAYATTDHALVLHEEGIATDRLIGVALVDESGREYARSTRRATT